jgi:uncharacterized iron-regulated membrane protein
VKTLLIRRYLLKVHLYLGLILGGAFALLGLTGSFLVFYPEIDRGLNPELVNPSAMHSPPSVQAWFDHLHAQFPERKGAWRIEIPRSSDQVVFARYLKPEETDPDIFKPMVVALDPNSGAVLNARMWGDYLVTWVYDLHYALLMGKSGTVLVSLLGMALLVSVLLGVYLWLPRGKQRFVKAIPKVRSGSKKAIYDIHSYTGAYGAVLLLLMIVTGVGLATPQWVEPLVNLFSVRMDKQTVYSSVPMPGTKRITADQAVSVGLAVFPTAKLRWIEAPIKVEDVYVLRLQQPAEPSQRFPKTFVWIDQFSGQVLASRDALKVNSGDAFFDWLHPLHNGEALGLTGRILAFVSGLLPLALFLTGWIRFRQKRNAKGIADQKQALKHCSVD